MADIDITEDVSDQIPDGGDAPVTDISTPDPGIDSDIHDEAERDPDGYVIDDDTDIGGGGDPIAPDSTPAVDPLPDPRIRTRTVKTVVYITDYSPTSLASFEAAGAYPVAVYDDGSEMRVEWADVSDPSPIGSDAVNEAAEVAAATNQHFWHRATDPSGDGAGTGAFVTDMEQDGFLEGAASDFSDMSDQKPYHNVLLNSLGMLIRKGKTLLSSFTRSGITFYNGSGNTHSDVVASFGKDGYKVGADGESYMQGDYHSLQMIDREGYPYFHISDLRDRSGKYLVAYSWIGNGLRQFFSLPYTAISDDYTVTVSDGSGGTATKTRNGVSFSEPPTDGSTVAVSYYTESRNLKAYTLGVRNNTYTTGPFSYVLGENCAASGNRSHAEGYNTLALGPVAHSEGYETKASGFYSHAQNIGTIAADVGQTAIGWYNEEVLSKNPCLLIIGNGTDDENRSNALVVDWDGSLKSAGEVTATGWNGREHYLSLKQDSLNDMSGLLSPLVDAVAYSADTWPNISTFGKFVQINGAVKPKSQVPSGGSLHILTIGQYDDDSLALYRPKRTVNVLCQGSGNATWLLTIGTDGVMTASRYRNGSTNAPIPTGTWLVFHVTYYAKY